MSPGLRMSIDFAWMQLLVGWGRGGTLARGRALPAWGVPALARGRAFALLALGHPALRHPGRIAEEELLHLLAEHLPGVGVRQIQPIVVDDQARLGLPHLPGLLRDVLEDALPQLARDRRLLKARQLAPELYAVYDSRHRTRSSSMQTGQMDARAADSIHHSAAR